MAVLGLGGIALVAWLLYASRARAEPATTHAIGWLLLGAVLGLPLVLGAPPGGRLVLWATLGTSAAVAVALVESAPDVRRRAAGWRARACAAGLLATWVLVVTPCVIARMLAYHATLARAVRADAHAMALDDVQSAASHVVAVTMPDAVSAVYRLPTRLAETGRPAPASFVVLSAAVADHRVRRTAADTLEVDVIGARLWELTNEVLFLSPAIDRTAVGARWETARFTATVTAADDVGPTSVAFRFRHALDDPAVRMLAWQDGALRALDLPAVGEAVVIPWSPSALRPTRRGR
jgi:hypothetical protein